MKILITKVHESFQQLKEICPHSTEDPDCHHPDQDFNCVTCHPCNCPLLLEELT